jgi:hypothetical protein
MELDPVERARRRLAALRGEGPSREAIEATLGRAQHALADLVETTAALEASVPERLSRSIGEAIEREVVPVARNLAEVRGLSGQAVRRLEALQETVDAERSARVADLEVLVELIVASWESLDDRLQRLERTLETVARAEAADGRDRPREPVTLPSAASLLRLDERRPSA